jgi:hypothetical protein
MEAVYSNSRVAGEYQFRDSVSAKSTQAEWLASQRLVQSLK